MVERQPFKLCVEGSIPSGLTILADTEWLVSFLVGYAETDFIESLNKIKIGKAYRI